MGERQRRFVLAGTRGGCAGGQDAFANAVCKALRMLRGRASMLTEDGSGAEDLVHDTIERALRAEHRPGEAALHPWLMRIMKNLAVDRWRAQRARRVCELREEDCVHHPSHDIEPWWWNVTAEEVDTAVAALPKRYREVLGVTLQDRGISYADGARQLGLKGNTFATRLFRARSRLRGMLSRGRSATRSR